MSFDVALAFRIVGEILEGLGNTLLVTALSFVGAASLGFVFEMLRRGGRVLRALTGFVVDFIRSTPVLVQIYFLYFVLPAYGIVLPAMVVGVLSLSIYFSGYLAEVFRAGIDAVPKGQSEAASSLGMGRVLTVVYVIAPQMLRNIAAPMGAYLVSVLKATPYLAVISVPEMLGSAFDVASRTYRYAEPMLVAGILFLILALIAVGLVSMLERRLGVLPKLH